RNGLNKPHAVQSAYFPHRGQRTELIRNHPIIAATTPQTRTTRTAFGGTWAFSVTLPTALTSRKSEPHSRKSRATRRNASRRRLRISSLPRRMSSASGVRLPPSSTPGLRSLHPVVVRWRRAASDRDAFGAGQALELVRRLRGNDDVAAGLEVVRLARDGVA